MSDGKFEKKLFAKCNSSLVAIHGSDISLKTNGRNFLLKKKKLSDADISAAMLQPKYSDDDLMML